MRINLEKTIKYILVLLFFYFSQVGAICYARFPAYANILMIGVFAVTMLIFGFSFAVMGKKVDFRCLVCGGICIINYAASMVANRDWRGSYALLCMNILTAVAFTAIFERKEFYKVYVDCTVFVSVAGIIATYVVLPVAASHIPIIETGGGIRYYDMGLAYPLIHVESHRLNAVWTEPGVFAAYLMFALIFSLFFVKVGKVKLGILIAAMLLTRSGTGYVLLVLIFGTYVLRYMLENKNLSLLFIALLSAAAVGIAGYLLFPDEVAVVLSKFQINSMNFIGRLAPMIYNMDVWTTSPLLGAGFHEGMFRVNYKIYRGVLFSNTSTTTLLFHNFGFVVPTMSMLASWRLGRQAEGHRLIALLLAFILILGVNFENQVLDQMYCIILFSIFMPEKERGGNENIIA